MALPKYKEKAQDVLRAVASDVEARRLRTAEIGNVGTNCGCILGLISKHSGLDEITAEQYGKKAERLMPNYFITKDNKPTSDEAKVAATAALALGAVLQAPKKDTLFGSVHSSTNAIVEFNDGQFHDKRGYVTAVSRKNVLNALDRAVKEVPKVVVK